MPYLLPRQIALERELPGQGGLGQEDLHRRLGPGQHLPLLGKEFGPVHQKALPRGPEGYLVAFACLGLQVDALFQLRPLEARPARIPQDYPAGLVPSVHHREAEAGFLPLGHLGGEGLLVQGEGGLPEELHLPGSLEAMGLEPSLNHVGALGTLEVHRKPQGTVLAEGAGDAGGGQGLQVLGKLQGEFPGEEARVGGGGFQDHPGYLSFPLALGLGGEGEVHLGEEAKDHLPFLSRGKGDLAGSFHLGAFHPKGEGIRPGCQGEKSLPFHPFRLSPYLQKTFPGPFPREQGEEDPHPELGRGYFHHIGGLPSRAAEKDPTSLQGFHRPLGAHFQ
ncbi:hypothetical protein HRbin38_00440 [bacterium HR38]|nr:hypothetical protein HRbin38_00440 [bacterium HR38]